MSNRRSSRVLLLVVVTAMASSILRPAFGEMLQFSSQLSAAQEICLTDVIHKSHWGYSPQSRTEMPKAAEVAAAQLGGRHTAFIYVFEADGWCGTAGCPLLIGELKHGGTCRLLYDGMGDKSFTVLRRRDRGYRRIYAPCEARFDGHQYQQLHDECPNPDVHH